MRRMSEWVIDVCVSVCLCGCGCRPREFCEQTTLSIERAARKGGTRTFLMREGSVTADVHVVMMGRVSLVRDTTLRVSFVLGVLVFPCFN